MTGLLKTNETEILRVFKDHGYPFQRAGHSEQGTYMMMFGRRVGPTAQMYTLTERNGGIQGLYGVARQRTDNHWVVVTSGQQATVRPAGYT